MSKLVKGPGPHSASHKKTTIKGNVLFTFKWTISNNTKLSQSGVIVENPETPVQTLTLLEITPSNIILEIYPSLWDFTNQVTQNQQSQMMAADSVLTNVTRKSSFRRPRDNYWTIIWVVTFTSHTYILSTLSRQFSDPSTSKWWAGIQLQFEPTCSSITKQQNER